MGSLGSPVGVAGNLAQPRVRFEKGLHSALKREPGVQDVVAPSLCNAKFSWCQASWFSWCQASTLPSSVGVKPLQCQVQLVSGCSTDWGVVMGMQVSETAVLAGPNAFEKESCRCLKLQSLLPHQCRWPDEPGNSLGQRQEHHGPRKHNLGVCNCSCSTGVPRIGNSGLFSIATAQGALKAESCTCLNKGGCLIHGKSSSNEQSDKGKRWAGVPRA